MTIKILGAGCKKCLNLERKVRDLAQQNNVDAVIEKITDIKEIMNYGIMMTPGLVINEQVKSYGIIPKDDLLIKWLKEN